MSGKEKNQGNKIKYSIWDTRIDENQRQKMRKSPELKGEQQQKFNHDGE